MKVIFLEDNRVENVSEGYARNFLLPRNLVIAATPKALAAVEKRMDKKNAELEQRRTEMQAVADKLSAMEIVVTADVGEEGKLFGSVTAADIAEAVKKTAGVEIDRKKIDLNEPLKNAGEYTVAAKLFRDVTATLKVIVTAR